MLRVAPPPPPDWEALLPEQLLSLPAELAAIDTSLDDDRFIAPWRAVFAARLGRPSVPVQTLLRLLYLKHRYQLGYETLCREVTDSIGWRRFCRIGLDQPVPHPTTLVKLVGRAGPQVVGQLNQALLGKLADDKLLRCRKLRVDTTVVAANVASPTDLGLLARAVCKLVSITKRVQAAGGATRTRVRDRRRAARRRTHEVARAMRSMSGAAKQVVFEVTRQVAVLAKAQLVDAGRIVANARRSQRGSGSGRVGGGRCRALVDHLQATIGQARRLLDQARVRLAGGMPDGASRLVSLHDPDARPIRKGRIGHPVEFGYKAQVADNPDGIVCDYTVMVGNPADAPLLVPPSPGSSRSPAGHQRRSPPTGATARPPSTTTWSLLASPGSPSPARARPAPTGKRSSTHEGFRRLVKWRTGSEGRVSQLKHHFGWARTLMDGIDGAQIWCGLGVFAHNLAKLGGLLQAKRCNVARRP